MWLVHVWLTNLGKRVPRVKVISRPSSTRSRRLSPVVFAHHLPLDINTVYNSNQHRCVDCIRDQIVGCTIAVNCTFGMPADIRNFFGGGGARASQGSQGSQKKDEVRRERFGALRTLLYIARIFAALVYFSPLSAASQFHHSACREPEQNPFSRASLYPNPGLTVDNRSLLRRRPRPRSLPEPVE